MKKMGGAGSAGVTPRGDLAGLSQRDFQIGIKARRGYHSRIHLGQRPLAGLLEPGLLWKARNI